MPPRNHQSHDERLDSEMQERWATQTRHNEQVWEILRTHVERLAIIETKVFYIAAGFGFAGSTLGSLVVGLILWFVKK